MTEEWPSGLCAPCLFGTGEEPADDGEFQPGAVVIDGLVFPPSPDFSERYEFLAVPLFAGQDFPDIAGLAERLARQEDAVTRFLWRRFSAPLRDLLLSIRSKGSGAAVVSRLLAQELNGMVLRGTVHTPRRFAGVELSPETRDLLESGTAGAGLARLNRRLLEDALAPDIKRASAAHEPPSVAGGQGEIFCVYDRWLRRFVALKRLKAAQAAPAIDRSRFVAEAQIAGQLQHPNFLPIHDLGADTQGRPFYTTSLLSGRTFGDVVREVHETRDRDGLALRRALGILVQVTDAMAYAHARGVCHRDLKPANLLIGSYGEVFVIDFGSAAAIPSPVVEEPDGWVTDRVGTERTRVLAGQPGSPLSTLTGGMHITPVYSPPELFDPEAGIPGIGADLYAMGVMLYELACGRLPYAGADGAPPDLPKLRQQLREGPPEPVRRIKRTVSRDLAAICEQAMAWRATDRYSTMTDLGADLRALLETRVVQARRPGRWARAQKWAVRRSRWIAAGLLVLGTVGIALTFAYSFKVEKDHARQLNHFRDAQLAARQGEWRRVIDHLDQAGAAGYPDRIELGLQRADAWTALAVHDRAAAELARLETLPDPGPRLGAVLLRLGEHHLFDRATWETGLDHVRRAQLAGLNRADAAFARGLLAETSPAALAHFQEALRLDSFHHGAHRAALGLGFLLGDRPAVESHLRSFKVFYPDDPSPHFIEAAWLALDGRGDEAEARLAAVSGGVNPRLIEAFQSGLAIMAQGARLFAIERLLGVEDAEPVTLTPLLMNTMALFLNRPLADTLTDETTFRFPQLPCVKQGLEQGVKAVVSLALSPFGNPDTAIAQLEQACAVHPEALLPMAAGMLLDTRRPTRPDRLAPFLDRQSRLFQMAAGMPSAVPEVSTQARFMAALTQLERGALVDAPDPVALRACATNLAWFLRQPITSARLAEAGHRMAFRIGELDIARDFLVRWSALEPDNLEYLRRRIEVEIAIGAYGAALESIARLLADHPADAGALAARERALTRLRELAESAGARASSGTNP